MNAITYLPTIPVTPDRLEPLLRQIYNVKEGYVFISNVRLFTLLFLLDWTCLIHGTSPFTSSAQWRMGRACAYPYDYYLELKNSGYFEGEEGTERELIWQANCRIIMQVGVNTPDTETDLDDTQRKAIDNVLGLLKHVTDKYGVDLSKSDIHDNSASEDSVNEFDSRNRFKLIDRELLDYTLALEPLLNNFGTDKDIKMAEYAKRHRKMSGLD